ncbi:MAG: hypothetical protein WA816_16275 [Bacteroidales bacterium]
MESPLENRKIEIEQETLNHLNTTRKWAMFLAIIGFIILGMFIVIAAIAVTFFSAFKSSQSGFGISESMIFVILLLVAIVSYFPIRFLFRFSKFTSHAIHTIDKLEFNKAIKNLKYYFAYIGVLIIIILSIYIVVLIIAGSSLAFLKGL